MPLIPLSLDTLGQLNDGAAGLLINRRIAEAVADLEDRGGEDGKARAVEIRLELTIVKGVVLAAVEASAKVPRFRTDSHAVEIARRDGASLLLFRDHSPEDPRQTAIPEIENRDS
jgi:hypothetical protein